MQVAVEAALHIQVELLELVVQVVLEEVELVLLLLTVLQQQAHLEQVAVEAEHQDCLPQDRH